MHADVVKAVLAALEAQGARYVVFGAVALNLLGLPRATEDLDLFVAPTEDNIERVKAALRAVFQDPAIEEIRSSDLLGDYPAVRYAPPEGPFYVDMLTRLGEAFRFEDLEAQRVDFEGVSVTVATPRTLYRMKRGTVRPKDWGDAAALRARFGLEDA